MIDEHRVEPADVLLVEDNPGDVRLTREAFKEGQVANTLHVAKDGVEALDFLFRRNDYADAARPDLILLDLNLPRKNGDEVLEEIRERPTLRRIPVIVLTSSEAQEDVVRSYELCANAFLQKPVDPTAFIETVRSLEQFYLAIVHLPESDDSSVGD